LALVNTAMKFKVL